MNQKVSLYGKSENISFLTLFSIFNKKNFLNTLLITLVVLSLGMVYLYFATPRYISYTSLEVDATAAKQHNVRADDLISSLHEPTISDVETEIDVIKSDLLLSKVLAKISDGVKYYSLDGLKKREYYTDTPFMLKDIKVFDKSIFHRFFLIKVLDSKRFSISQDRSWLTKFFSLIPLLKDNALLTNKVFHFGERVTGKNFSFVINNIDMQKGHRYAFSILYQPEQIQYVRKYLNVKPASARSSVISLTYEDTKAVRARDFLELLSYEYIKQNVDNKSKNASSTLKFLDMQLKTVKEQLKRSSDKLKAYKEKNNFLNIGTKSQEVVNKLVEYDRQYAQTKLQYQAFLILKHELVKGNFSAMSGFGREYPILDTLVGDLQAATAQKEVLLTTLTQRHPDVIAQSKKIRDIKNSIQEIAKSIEKELKQKLGMLKRMVIKENKVMENLPQKEQSLANLERLYGVNEKLFSYLLQRQSELSLLQASKVSDIRILDKAHVALKPSKPNRKVVLLLSLFLGLLFSFIISLFKFNRRIKTVDDLKEHTNIPLFGIIPYVESKEAYNSAYVLDDPSSTASEAFRAMRTNLDYIVTPGNSKVVLVTSNIPNEGKTVVAANLASVIGMSEKKVIILSLDLRRPEMHHKFGLSNKLGMSDVLSQKAALKEVIWEHEIYPNLNIITSGRIPPNPAELLASKQMQKVIEKLKKKYDYIILDTPPINYVADAVALFKYADINLFVVKSDFTDEKYIHELNTMVSKLGLEHAGIIFNSVKKKYNKTEQFDYKYLYYEPL